MTLPLDVRRGGSPVLPFLLLALASGLPALLLQTPFLTHQWQFWDKGFALSTALVFDIGVYLAVLGAVCAFVGYYLGEEADH